MLEFNAGHSGITTHIAKLALARIPQLQWRMHPIQEMAIVNLAIHLTVVHQADSSESAPEIFPGKHFEVNFCGIRVVLDENMPESEITLENTNGELLAIIRNLAIPC